MTRLLYWLGVEAIATLVDYDCFLLGVKYDDCGIVEEDPEAAVLFFFLGPFSLMFIFRGDEEDE